MPPVLDRASATRARHASLPTSQSKDSVCSARRFGTSSGSRILAKEVRAGAPGIPDRALWNGLTGARDCQDASFQGLLSGPYGR